MLSLGAERYKSSDAAQPVESDSLESLMTKLDMGSITMQEFEARKARLTGADISFENPLTTE